MKIRGKTHQKDCVALAARLDALDKAFGVAADILRSIEDSLLAWRHLY